MKIQRAEYLIRDKYPLLRLTIDGVDTTIGTTEKPILHDAGYVYLGSAFENILPVVEIEGSILSGMTNDPSVFAVVDQFNRDCGSGMFAPGPVTYK